MITFQNVTKNYSSNVGLENVSVHIDKGDFVFLVGPSGAGKSTFIKLILREINVDKGLIMVGGKDVTRLSNREIPMYRRQIGMVFQDFRLLPKKTVYENVAFAMEILHQSKRKIRKRVPQILSLVGISDKADQYPDELSAGEQQRVAIARAIVNNPTVLIADEPTGNLDPDTAWEIMDLLKQINMTGTTVVMVTHAKDIVDRMDKRVVAIDKGRIVRDEFGSYGFEAEEDNEDIDAKEADFQDEMYASIQEDSEVPLEAIAVSDGDFDDENADYDINMAEDEAGTETDLIVEAAEEAVAENTEAAEDMEDIANTADTEAAENIEDTANTVDTEAAEDMEDIEDIVNTADTKSDDNFHVRLQSMNDELYDKMADIRETHSKNNPLADDMEAGADTDGEGESDA